MPIIFTICSNNYLAQASVLGYSVREQMKTDLICLLVDEPNAAIDYSNLPLTIIPIRNIEANIDVLAEKYNIIELNACLKPSGFKYFMDNFKEEKIIFLDPDTMIFSSFDTIEQLLDLHEILLTPHILSPISPDKKRPSENTFLNYGLYNAGFIAVRGSEESTKFINWWKERTHENGFDKVHDGIYADQLYLNLVPVFFKGVHIIADIGCNVAPWNIHERYLTKANGVLKVNDQDTLKFFHFGSFIINSNELPVHYYNRFFLKDREDLHELYDSYNKKLLAAGYLSYHKIDCCYFERYIDHKLAGIETAEQIKWSRHSFLKKLFYRIVPKSAVKVLLAKTTNVFNGYPYADF